MKTLSLSTASLLFATITFPLASVASAPQLAGVSVVPPVLNGIVEGSFQVNSVPPSASLTINGGSRIEGTLLLPGSPHFRFNGGDKRPLIVAGNGSAEPAGYRVTVNGSHSIESIITHSQPLEIPSTTPPLPASGTRTLVINNPGDVPNDFSSFRSIIIHRDVGEVLLPPGQYEQLICNGGARVLLGSPDGVAAGYDLQSIVLNQGTVEPRGNVLIRLGSSLSINGNSHIGAPDHPERLLLDIHRAGLTLNGNARFFGRVLAPDGEIHLNGGTLLKGFALAKKMVLNGNGTLRFAETNVVPDPSEPPPVAIPTSYSLWAGEAFPFTLQAQGDGASSLRFQLLELPQQGQLQAADGTVLQAETELSEAAFPLSYLSYDGFVGEDQLLFVVENKYGISDPAVVRFHVHPYLLPSVEFTLFPPSFTNQRRPAVGAVVSPGSAELDFDSFSFYINGQAISVESTGSGLEIEYEEDLLDGWHEVLFRVADVYGFTTTISASFYVDTVPPDIEMVSIQPEVVLDMAQPELLFRVEDLSSGLCEHTVEAHLDGEPLSLVSAGGGWFAAEVHEPLRKGRYTLEIAAGDLAGNRALLSVPFGIDEGGLEPETVGMLAWAGGEVRGLNGVLISGARVGIRGLEGAYRTEADGTYTVAVPGFENDDGQLRILEFSAPGYITSYRRVKLYPGTINTIPVVYLKERDSKVTWVGPEGGTLTNSDGSIVVDIPAGALPTAQPIQATNYEAGYELAFPLPNTVTFTYALELIPEGLTFPEPVSVRMRNDLGFDPGTPIPVGYFNPDAVRWQHESMAFVSEDGEWVEFEVSHFSVRDINLPAAPVSIPANVDGNEAEVNPQQEEVDPFVTIGRGVGTVGFSLPQVHALNAPQTVSFVYRSDNATSSRLIDLSYDLSFSPSAVLRYSVGIGGVTDEAVYSSRGTGRQRISSLWVERPNLESGFYPSRRSIANELVVPFGAFAGAGRRWGSREELISDVLGRELVSRSSSIESWTFWRNESQSAFGAGWTMQSLDRVFPAPGNRSVVVARGDGGHAVFKPGGVVEQALPQIGLMNQIQAIEASPEGGFIIASEGELLHWSPGSEPEFISEGILRAQNTGYGVPALLPLEIGSIALSETGEIYLTAFPFGDWSLVADHQGILPMGTGIFRRSFYDDEVAEILPLDQKGVPMSYDRNSGNIYFLENGRLYSTAEDGRHLPVWHDFEEVLSFTIDQNRARILFATQTTVYAVDISDENDPQEPVELFSLSMFEGADDVFLPKTLTVAPDGTVSALARKDTFLLDETWLVRVEANGATANRYSIGRITRNVSLISDTFGTLFLIRESRNVSRLDLRGTEGFVHSQDQHQFISEIPSGWQWEDVNGNHKLFNTEGYLIEERDRNGNRTTYAYDSEMRLQVKTDPLGRETRFAYSADGRIDTITDAVGRTTRFFHNAAGQLIRVALPDGSERTFEYDGKHRMLGFADEEGYWTEFSISDEGFYREILFPDGGLIELSGVRTRATGTRPELPAVPLVSSTGLPPAASGAEMDSIVNQLGSKFEYKTDARGQFTQVRDAKGHQVFFDRDGLGRLTDVRVPGFGRRSYLYNDYGNLIRSTREDNRAIQIERGGPFNFPTSIVGYGGERSRIEYDASGNPTRITDPLDRETVIAYNSRGQPTMVTNPLGEQWAYQYDVLGNLISATDPNGGTTFLTRNLAGQVTSVTDPTGKTTSFSYDLMGRLLTTTSPDGGVWRQTYTPRGLLESSTDPLGHLTRYFYDAKGRLVRLIDPSGGETHYTYDAADNLLSVTNPEGEVTLYTYNGNNKLISVQTGDLPASFLTYDALGRLLSETDANGQVTSRIYDSVGRVIRVIRPDGEVLEMEYDALDNLIRLEDPRGGVMEWNYDLARRLLSETNTTGQTSHYSYDAADRLMEKVNRRGQKVRYDYDPAGRLIRLALEGGDLNTYTYDAAGRLTQASNAHSTIALAYDAAGRLTESVQPAGQVSYAYNLAGKLTQRLHPGGTETFGYDAAGRLSQITSSALGSFSIGLDAASRMNTLLYPNAIELQLERDPSGRMQSMDYLRSGMSIIAHHQHLDAVGNLLEDDRTVFASRTFEYDVLDRLTSVASGGLLEEAFAYDSLGNWLVDARVHDPANRLLSDQWASFGYDDDGNLTEVDGAEELTRYTYDALGRLESALVAGQTVHYRYDPLGRRYSVSVNGAETLTLFDGWEEMGELKEGSFYSWLTVAGMRLAADTEQGVVYLHAGLEGSIQSASDSSGTIVQHYHYSAFGVLNVLDATGTWLEPGEALSPWLFHGRLHEASTGLYWMRARHYSPELGRFLQPDPIGIAGGINLYAYANNNPLRWFDPWGLDPVSVEEALGRRRTETSIVNELNPFNPYGSFSRMSISVSDTMGGMLGWTWGKITDNQFLVDASNDQMLGAYEDSSFGQTVDGPAWSYYGTRGAWTVSSVGTGGYVISRMPPGIRTRVLMEAITIYIEGHPGGPTLDDYPFIEPPQNPVPTGPSE